MTSYIEYIEGRIATFKEQLGDEYQTSYIENSKDNDYV